MLQKTIPLTSFLVRTPAQPLEQGEFVMLERRVPANTVEEFIAGTRIGGRLALVLAITTAALNATVALPNKAVIGTDGAFGVTCTRNNGNAVPIYRNGTVPGSPPAIYGVVTPVNIGGVEIASGVVFTAPLGTDLKIAHFPAQGIIKFRLTRKEVGTFRDIHVQDLKSWNTKNHDASESATRLQNEGAISEDRFVQVVVQGVDATNHVASAGSSYLLLEATGYSLDEYAALLSGDLLAPIYSDKVAEVLDFNLARV